MNVGLWRAPTARVLDRPWLNVLPSSAAPNSATLALVTVATFVLRPSELSSLDVAGLLLLSARVALRVHPWLPREAEPWADRALDSVVAAARGAPLARAKFNELHARLSASGARAANADAVDGRWRNYAAIAVCSALIVTQQTERKPLVRAVIDAAKFACSIAAGLAHEKRVTEAPPEQSTLVDFVCERTWSQLRRDIALIAAVARTAGERYANPEARSLDAITDAHALRALAPLWDEPSPSWAAPSTASRG